MIGLRLSNDAMSYSFKTLIKDGLVSDNTESKIVTADALALPLHNQHALATAIEELTKWLADSCAEGVATNAISAMEALDRNTAPLKDAIMRLQR